MSFFISGIPYKDPTLVQDLIIFEGRTSKCCKWPQIVTVSSGILHVFPLLSSIPPSQYFQEPYVLVQSDFCHRSSLMQPDIPCIHHCKNTKARIEDGSTELRYKAYTSIS